MTENPYKSPPHDTTSCRPGPRTYVIHSIPFLSFIWLATRIGFSIGIVIGVAALCASPFGVFDFALTPRLGGFAMQGIAAGVPILLMAPLYFGLVSMVLSVPAYIPFSFITRLFGGLRLNVRNLPGATPDSADSSDQE